MLTSQSNGFRYFIELAFNGTAFHGWQIQPGAETVQEIINKALGTLTGEPVNVVGCGRTDAGVHASHFVAHFDVMNPVPDCIQLAYRLNRFINRPVRIDRITPVNGDLHARFHALSRTYHYLISSKKAPFMRDFCWEYTLPLDIEAMNTAAAALLGKHDFTSFSKLHTDVMTNNCEVIEAKWLEHSDMLVFAVTSDRFLRNMVRAIVGTLVDAGRGKIQPEEVKHILELKDRGAAGASVPARGLFLSRVEYDPELFRINARTPFSDWF